MRDGQSYGSSYRVDLENASEKVQVSDLALTEDWCDSLKFDLLLIGFWAYFTFISLLNVNNNQTVDLCVIVAYSSMTILWVPKITRRVMELWRERGT